MPLLICISACEKDDKAKTGKVSVAFDNGTASSFNLLTLPAGASGVSTDGKTPLYAASQFASKLVQIYLNEDVGANGYDNVGSSAYIWINPVCGIEESEDGTRHIANNGNCDTTKIEEFFEFARPTAEVNASLNSQESPVRAGTYRYIRLQVCDNTIAENNIKFTAAAAGLTTAFTGRTNNCILKPVKIDPPLEVAEGDVVKLSLNYNLNKALADYCYDVETGPKCDANYTVSGPCTWTDTKDGIRCYEDLNFVPTVSK